MLLEIQIAFKVMIDHHQEPDSDAADIVISDTSSCSTVSYCLA